MKQNFMGGGDYLQERLLVVISKGVGGGGRLYFLVNRRNLVTNISLSTSYETLCF